MRLLTVEKLEEIEAYRRRRARNTVNEIEACVGREIHATTAGIEGLGKIIRKFVLERGKVIR